MNVASPWETATAEQIEAKRADLWRDVAPQPLREFAESCADLLMPMRCRGEHVGHDGSCLYCLAVNGENCRGRQ